MQAGTGSEGEQIKGTYSAEEKASTRPSLRELEQCASGPADIVVLLLPGSSIKPYSLVNDPSARGRHTAASMDARTRIYAHAM